MEDHLILLTCDTVALWWKVLEKNSPQSHREFHKDTENSIYIYSLKLHCLILLGLKL